ncbi:MAG TPA: acyltransferase [Solirubrobacteraceae bacterium]|jgi:peptidoglycan/LPS O-acetylase OafA/YrhL|nr:acyltransferase [Solirubrobacteraceae bacterium]
MVEGGGGRQSERDRGLREPLAAVDVALSRDEAVDRTAERNRSAVVDAVRALAALMVLVAHTSFIANNGYPGSVGYAIRQMLGAGVLIFFSLSGYLIAGPYLRALVEGRPLPRISSYFVRRAARIYPAYWIAFAAVLIFLWPPGGVRAYQFPVHLLLLQSSWPVNGEPTSIFFVAWTLGVEAAFYTFVPLAALLLRAVHRGPWRPSRLAAVVVVGAVASAAWSYIAATQLAGDRSHLVLLTEIGLQVWLYFFCPGMIIALAATADGWGAFKRLMAMPWLTLPAAAVLWGAAYAMERSSSPFLVENYQFVFVLGAGVFLGTIVVAGSWITPIVRVLAPIGLISYGIYLWHDTVVQVIWKHTQIGFTGGPGAWLGDVVLVLAITLPIAVVSWFAVERPLMRRAAAWARRRSSAPPVPAAPPPATRRAPVG